MIFKLIIIQRKSINTKLNESDKNDYINENLYDKLLNMLKFQNSKRKTKLEKKKKNISVTKKILINCLNNNN